ncbi:MAG: hypothetical protein ACRDQ2_05635 [Gaiellales bacterium]
MKLAFGEKDVDARENRNDEGEKAEHGRDAHTVVYCASSEEGGDDR